MAQNDLVINEMQPICLGGTIGTYAISPNFYLAIDKRKTLMYTLKSG